MAHHVNKKPTPNMVDMHANPKKSLIMKDMGNGHMRPYLWGTSVTVASGETQALVASGILAGTNVEDGVYSPCMINDTTACYISKDCVEHTVKLTMASPASDDVEVDVFVFMSAAASVDVGDYKGNRGYLTGTY